jgi:hypothetical protein
MCTPTAAATWPPLYEHPQAPRTIAGAFIVYDVVTEASGRRVLAGLFREEGGQRHLTVLLRDELLQAWLRHKPALFEPVGLFYHPKHGVRLIPNFGPSRPAGEPARPLNLADLIPDALAQAVRAAIDEEHPAWQSEGDR